MLQFWILKTSLGLIHEWLAGAKICQSKWGMSLGFYEVLNLCQLMWTLCFQQQMVTPCFQWERTVSCLRKLNTVHTLNTRKYQKIHPVVKWNNIRIFTVMGLFNTTILFICIGIYGFPGIFAHTHTDLWQL